MSIKYKIINTYEYVLSSQRRNNKIHFTCTPQINSTRLIWLLTKGILDIILEILRGYTIESIIYGNVTIFNRHHPYCKCKDRYRIREKRIYVLMKCIPMVKKVKRKSIRATRISSPFAVEYPFCWTDFIDID